MIRNHRRDTSLPVFLFTWFLSVFNIYMKSGTLNADMSTKEFKKWSWHQKMSLNVFPFLFLIFHFPLNIGISQLQNGNIFQKKVNQHKKYILN